MNTDGQLKVLETDLHATRDTVAALKDRNKYLGKTEQLKTNVSFLLMFDGTLFLLYTEDLHQVAKAQNDDLDNENARLNGESTELF